MIAFCKHYCESFSRYQPESDIKNVYRRRVFRLTGVTTESVVNYDAQTSSTNANTVCY